MKIRNHLHTVLIASAAFLGGMIVTQLVQSPTPAAQANMVIQGESFVALTAAIEDNNEGLFLLGAQTGDLIVYKTDRNGIQPVGFQNFSKLANPTGGAGGRR